jgi:hypothetical protein
MRIKEGTKIHAVNPPTGSRKIQEHFPQKTKSEREIFKWEDPGTLINNSILRIL